MLVGYARVSTAEQNLDRQIMALIDHDVDRRNIYQEQASGTKDLLDVIDIIKAKGAFIKSIKDT